MALDLRAGGAGVPAAARRRAWAAYLVLGSAATAAYAVLSGHLALAVVYDAVAFSAAAAILAGVWLHRPERRLPWLLLALGVVLWGVGEVSWSAYELVLDGSPPFPSFVDAFYLSGYALVLASMGLLVRARDPGRSLTRMVDASIVAVAFAIPAWVFLIEDYLEGSSALQTAVTIAYPAMDIGIAAALARFVFAPDWRRPAYGFFAAGALLLWVVDFLYFGAIGGSYGPGSWVFAGYVLFYVAWGAAALHPSMSDVSRPGPAREPRLTTGALALLGGSIVAGFGVLAWKAAGPGVNLVETAIAAVLFLLVLVRMATLAQGLQLLRVEERAARLESELARAEAETAQRLLAEQNDRLRDLDRAKDEFLSLVTHDLRTPLTSILGYADLLHSGQAGELEDEQREFLGVMRRNSQRLLRLVDDLLFVARYQAGRLELEPEPADLAELAGQSVQTVMPRASAKGVTLDLEAHPCTVTCDRSRVAQLLDNLITNAVKFTPAGGHVDVRVSGADGAAVLEVSDTGIGIPPEEQRRLFERFYRASAAADGRIEGTGLGLSIAKAIVDAHGGRLSVASEQGVGSTFRVELPVGDAEPPDAQRYTYTVSPTADRS